MLIKDIIKIAAQMRQGNNFDNEVVERWIDECDCEIQLNIHQKKENEIIRLCPEWFEAGKSYKKGQRVSVNLSGERHIFVALSDNEGNASPKEDTKNWEEIPFETSVGFPYDKVYYLYIIAMIDYANRDYDMYDNDMIVYNSALTEYAKWWQRNRRYEKGKVIV